MSWKFQYWNGTAWVNFANAQVDHILEELSSVGGQEELVFSLPNTADNRSIVQSKPFVQALFNGSVIFPLADQNAIVTGLQYSTTVIQVTAYNYIFVQLSQASSTVTQNYTNTAVSTIAAYICSLAGVTVGSVPALSVSIKFKNANCFKALQDLTKACGSEYWVDSSGFNIGTRDGTTQTLGYVGANSKRGLDYSKQVDQVIVNGVDASGVVIQGHAGSPGAIATFTEKKASDIGTLNSIAAFKLQTLNNPSNGNSLECLISQVATWHPGQYVSANRVDLDLVGSFIIQRITKQAVSCTVEVDAAMPQMDILLQDTDKYADLGIYQADPGTNTPSALTLQQLLRLYHLTEGNGADAYDSTPNGTPINGKISGGSWVNGAILGTKVLSFAGSGQVECPVNDTFSDKVSIGCWFSPSELIDQAAMMKKDINFTLELSGTSGAIRFGLHIGSSWVYLTSPTGVIPFNGRCFAMGVYDGAKMHLYVSDPSSINQLLTYDQVQTGNLDVSSAALILAGSGFKGVDAECMVWGRALSAQEVQELFFNPLSQVMGLSQSQANGDSILTTLPNIQNQAGNSPTTSYIKGSCVLGDGAVVAAPTGAMITYEAGYTCLALIFKNGTDEMALVQKILDCYSALQNADGSWYQQYNPGENALGSHDRKTMIDNTYSGDLKVDSGCALLIHAMADWDRLNSQTRYKTVVQLGLSWLHTLSYDHTVAAGNNLISNLIYQGTVDTMAFAADSAECLLAMLAALDAYGDGLLASDSYSVKTLANGVFYGLVAYAYRGDSVRAYATTDPIGSQCLIPFTYKENISYAQAITAMAVKNWSVSSHNTAGDFSAQAEKVLDNVMALTHGQWDGQLYVPYLGNSDEDQNEYAVYTALVCMAMQAVNPTKYANAITQLQHFIRQVTTVDGKVYDQVDKNGMMYIALLNQPGAALQPAYGFITLTAATALLSGA